MGFFNLTGLLASMVACGIAWLPTTYLERTQSTGVALCYFVLFAFFVSALLALCFDRFPERTLLSSYWNASTQFYYQAFGKPMPDGLSHDPRRRLLVFVWPLAYGPAIHLTLSLMLWLVDTLNGNEFATIGEHALYSGLSAVALVVTFVLAFATQGIRTITR